MITFNEAEQARLSIKMLLSNYWWYLDSSAISDGDEYCVLVHSKYVDNEIKKIVPTVHKNVSVKVETVVRHKEKKF